MNKLIEKIETKIEIERKNRDKIFDELMNTNETDQNLIKLRNKYWLIIGQIEAYTNVINLIRGED